jgi:hypothetical protein
MSEDDPRAAGPLDFMAIVSGLQSQIDELVRAQSAQQKTIDALRADVARLSGTDDER